MTHLNDIQSILKAMEERCERATHCSVCGSACIIHSSSEGTSFAEPSIRNTSALVKALNEALTVVLLAANESTTRIELGIRGEQALAYIASILKESERA